jgi:3-oxoacyl-[acyl-carrier protein] reductase
MRPNIHTAIVTGTARGIGAAAARRLSGDGMAVAVLDLDESACKPAVEAIESAGGTALAVGVDVADEEAVPAAVARVADELATPTVLVNNAGVTRDNLLFKMTTGDWGAVMSVHLPGSFLMSQATHKYMTEAGWGRIVQPVQRVCTRQPRPGQLLRGEGRPAGLHQDAGYRVG